MHPRPHSPERRVHRRAGILAPALLFAAATWAGAQVDQGAVKIVSVPAPDHPEIHLRLLVLSGSAEDPPGREGLAWFTAHLMAAAPAAQEASLRAEVGRDSIAFDLAAPAGHFEDVYPLFREAVLRPTFTAEAAVEQRAVQAGTLERLLADEAGLLREALNALIYREHPYGHPIPGRLGSIAAMEARDASAFHEEHFRVENVLLGLAGPIEDTLRDRIGNDFAALPDGGPVRQPRPVTFLPRPRILVLERPGITAGRLRAGHPVAVTAAHADYPPLLLATGLLSGPRTGLRANLEGRGPAGPGEPARGSWAFVVGAEFDPERGATAPGSILDTLERFRTDLAVPGDLDAARTAALAPGEARTGDPQGDLIRLTTDGLLGSPPSDGRLWASLQAVSAEAALRSLLRHLHPDRLGIAVLVPDAGRFIEALQALAEPEAQPPRWEIERRPVEGLFE